MAALPADPPFDAVCAFDAIHDQADPAGVLARAHAALVPGGTFLMMDVKAASDLEDNLDNPFAPWLYGVSTLHCMTVSLAQGGAGLGAVWGERVARQMLADAGFVDVSVHDVPEDPLDSVYVARKGRGRDHRGGPRRGHRPADARWPSRPVCGCWWCPRTSHRWASARRCAPIWA